MSIERSVVVRRLGAGDAASLDALMTVFGEAFEDTATYGDARPDTAWRERLLGSETFVALVALEGTTVVGGLTAYLLPKPERERSELYVHDLAVAESRRREGIATALVEASKGIAKASGAWVVFVQADRGDDPAIALYARLGTREDVLHFDIAPDRDG